MRAAICVLGLALALVVGVQAQDDKEVTLKGTITCAKCDLKLEKACHTVIKVSGRAPASRIDRADGTAIACASWAMQYSA